MGRHVPELVDVKLKYLAVTLLKQLLQLVGEI